VNRTNGLLDGPAGLFQLSTLGAKFVDRAHRVSIGFVVLVAGWRYTPGTPGWKDKENTDKYFIHAKGSVEWNLHDVDQQMRSIVLAGDAVYAAGVPTSQDPTEASELWVLSAADGSTRQTLSLENRPNMGKDIKSPQ